jgi:phosphopantothenoylcysteine decarboxylase/phosphopantothenate--cysteine ligase
MFGKKILLGVTGGIAAYKACEIASRLVQAGAEVDVVMTPAATEFVRPLTFQALTGRPVSLEMFALLREKEIGHISLANRADLILIAPLTANTLAKLAHGLADNLLSSTVLASSAPVLLAPAMNSGMYENGMTQQNLALVKNAGMRVIEPGTGRLACGTTGKGRLADLDQIIEEVEKTFFSRELCGKVFVVTAGGTREPLDPVRFLGNRSSGKMGYAIARSLLQRGARVKLISGPSALLPPAGTEFFLVETAQEMAEAMEKALVGASALVMAAAVADYRAAEISPQKIKKNGENRCLELVLNPDLLASCRGDYLRVGFAAESEELLPNAEKKRMRKGLDLIVANDITRADSGFDRDTNKVFFLDAGGIEELPVLTKDEVAERLVDRLTSLLTGRKKA